jgi:hypothetical protein
MSAPKPITDPDLGVRTHTAYDLERTLVAFIRQVVEPYRFDNPTLNLAQVPAASPPIYPPDLDEPPVRYDPTERAQTLYLKQPPRVVRGRIPRTVTGEIAIDKLSDFPHIVVQAISAHVEIQETIETVRIFVCMYDENPDGSGYQDCLNITEALAIALTTFGQGAIDQAYPIQLPLDWKLFEQDTFPHYLSEMTTQWEMPSGRPMPELAESIIPSEAVEIQLAPMPDAPIDPKIFRP